MKILFRERQPYISAGRQGSVTLPSFLTYLVAHGARATLRSGLRGPERIGRGRDSCKRAQVLRSKLNLLGGLRFIAVLAGRYAFYGDGPDCIVDVRRLQETDGARLGRYRIPNRFVGSYHLGRAAGVPVETGLHLVRGKVV